MLIPLLLYGILVPAAISAVVSLAFGRPWREPDKLAMAVPGLAIALGVVASSWGLSGMPRLMPLDAPDRLPHIAVLAAGLSVLEAFLPARRVRESVGGLIALVAAWLLVRPLAGESMNATEALEILGAGLALAGYGHLVARSMAGEHRLVGGALAVLLAGSAAIAVLASGTFKVGTMNGAVAAGSGTLFAILLVFRRAPSLDCVAGVVGMTSGSALIAGAAYSELPISSLVVLAVIPLVYITARGLLHGRLADRKATAVRLGLAGLLAAAAIAVAGMPPSADSQSTDDDQGYGYE